jgi:arylsulfatase
MMEVYAGFLTHTDAQVQRVLDAIDELGELDDTIVIVMSDNGASAEGGVQGSFNEQYFYNFVPESMEENLRRLDDLGTPRANNHYPWGWAWAGNTPLKRWKRETHEGGVTDPLIVSWPAGIGRPGETRHQYVHAIDVLPTLLDVLGIEAPDQIGGVTQSPVDGTSFAPTLHDAAAASAHRTQYYEMMGCRAMYHDGWKAVAFHPLLSVDYGDGRDPRAPFDDDEWELYHVAEDFSEIDDLADKEPEKLQELVELWWAEAERYDVLPLNNQPGRHGDRRHRRDRYVYHPGIGSLPEVVAPNLRNRAFHVAAELHLSPDRAPDGVVVAHGSHAGGYAVYVKGGRLHYVHNFLGAAVTTIGADVALPADGTVVARVAFRPTGRFAGDVALYYDDVPVGQGHVEPTVPITYGVEGFTVGHQRGSAVSSDYEAPFAIDPQVLSHVVIDAAGRPYRDPAAEERVAAARQ